MLVHLRITPQLYVAGTHLFTIWVKRDKVDTEVPFLRKQLDGRGLNPGDRGVNRLATHTSTEEHQPNFKHMGEPNKAKGNQF